MSTGLAALSGRVEYEIRIDSHALRDLRRISLSDYKRVDERICALGLNPRPTGVAKLRDRVYRIRIGPWRVIYLIDDAHRVVVVNAIRRREKDTCR